MDMREASRPGASVLIVEDDWQISTAVQRYLARAGLRPLEPAHDGADAVRRAARERPDLVILDITLAGPLDGLDAAERIHGTPPFPPVIFLTGASDDATLARAVGLGAVGYVLKPFQPAQLLSAVRIGLAIGRAEREHRRERARRQDGTAGHAGPRGPLPAVGDPLASPRDPLPPAGDPLPPGGDHVAPLEQLTPRERQIVRLLQARYRPRLIAQTLDISYHTVRNHLKHIFRKLGVSSQLELLVMGDRLGGGGLRRDVERQPDLHGRPLQPEDRADALGAVVLGHPRGGIRDERGK